MNVEAEVLKLMKTVAENSVKISIIMKSAAFIMAGIGGNIILAIMNNLLVSKRNKSDKNGKNKDGKSG